MITGLPQPGSANFGAKMREWALVGMGLTQNKLDTFVTLRDLQAAGIANISAQFLAGPAGSGRPIGPGTRPVIVQPAIDLTPPPPPGGFVATSGITQILFETAAPVYRQGHGHARTKIYAANYSGGPLPTFSAAVLYTDFPGNIGVAPFDPASSLRLWATWTSADGVESEPTGGTNGIAAATGLLEDQHIANVSVGKLLAGSIAVGQFIQSADYVAGTTGWRIATLAGGGAFFEVRGNAVFGGTIFAGAGQIGGSDIGTTFMRSSNYVLNTQGWALNSNGTGQIGGFTVTNTGIQSVNYVAGTSGWRFDFGGAIEARSGTFAGALAAASGTFSGTLTASAINAVDTINIAGQAVTAPAFVSGSVADLSMTYTLTGAPGVPFSVFILASLVQSSHSTIELDVNGSMVWTEAPLGGTVLCKGWVVSLVPGTHTIRVFSTDPTNTNGTAIYALATKR